MKTRSQTLKKTGKVPKVLKAVLSSKRAAGAAKPRPTGAKRLRMVLARPVNGVPNRFRGLSHADLDKEFSKVGTVMSLRAKGLRVVAQIPIESGYNAGMIRVIVDDSKLIASKKGFGSKYRRIHLEQDELLSTSSVRELMSGLISRGKIPAKYLPELERVFENISRVRFPTAYSGFAVNGDFMQHPTAKGTGIFAESSQTMGRHNQLDLERKQEAAQAMVDEAAKPNATAEQIANAGLRAAIGFTLNVFTAPATAGDVQPFLQGTKTRTQAELKEQVKQREKLKAQLVRLGGTQEIGSDTSLTRRWGNRRGLRSASPMRKP